MGRLLRVVTGGRTFSRCCVTFLATWFVGSLYYFYKCHPCFWRTQTTEALTPENAPLIFVGGHESSGTGLLRVLLDVHPLIRCGAEPMVTLDLLGARHGMKRAIINRAIEAGIYPEAYDQAVAAFILKVIEKMGPPAPYLCHKQPTTFLYAKYLGFLFPKAKFVHILRDGRAVVSSLIERKFNPLFKKENALNGLRHWNLTVTKMLRQCQELGVNRCYTVIYEKLVIQPEIETRRLFEFLGIPWDPIVTRHETMLATITNPNPYEPSTKQFMQKIHTKSVDSWAGPKAVLSKTVLKNITADCTLLDTLGYTALGLPPDYTKMNSTLPVIK